MKNFKTLSVFSILTFSLSTGLPLFLSGCNEHDSEEVIPVIVKDLAAAQNAIRALKDSLTASTPPGARLDVEFALRVIDSIDDAEALENSAARTRSTEPLSGALEVSATSRLLVTLQDVQDALESAKSGLAQPQKDLADSARGTCRRFYDSVGAAAAKRKRAESDSYNPWDMDCDEGVVVNPLYESQGNEGENPLYEAKAVLSVTVPPGSGPRTVQGECTSFKYGQEVSIENVATGAKQPVSAPGSSFEFTVQGKSDTWSVYLLKIKPIHGKEGMRIARCRVAMTASTTDGVPSDARPITKSEQAALAEASASLREADTNFAVLLGGVEKEILAGEDPVQMVNELVFLSRLVASHVRAQRADSILHSIQSAGLFSEGILTITEMQERTSFAILLGQEEALAQCTQVEQRRFQTLSNASKARHDIALNAIRNMK